MSPRSHSPPNDQNGRTRPLAERAIGDLEVEVYGDLVLVDHAASARSPIFPGGRLSEPAARAVDHLADLREFALGRGE